MEKTIIELELFGIISFLDPVAITHQIRLKNLGINTALVDNYTLKFISKN